MGKAWRVRYQEGEDIDVYEGKCWVHVYILELAQ